jgi:hypothetical protein
VQSYESTGDIILTASAKGIKAGKIIIKAE